ncbi:MAG: hypothetical protein QM765_35845 [Myxococcales bacterium]
MAYRIEQAKTGRSACRECGRTIEQGSWRFGSDDGTLSRWFHLPCAAQSNLRSFKPFRDEAAKLLSAPANAATAAEPRLAVAARNPDLEKAVLEKPESAEALSVLADWLQTRGDPWGELIALTLAGKEREARKVMKEHQALLTGGLPPKFFVWHRGLIVRASLEARKIPHIVAQLETLFSLRTAFALRILAPAAHARASGPRGPFEPRTALPALALHAAGPLGRRSRRAAAPAAQGASLLGGRARLAGPARPALRRRGRSWRARAGALRRVFAADGRGD